MAFDYAGAFSSPHYSGHAQNLYGSNDSLATPFNATSGIEYYLSQGIPASKINLGNPIYGHAFQNTLGPGTLFNGTGNGSFDQAGGVWDYNQLPIDGSQVTIHEDDDLVLSYSYDNGTRMMISYDTPKIARRKARYVNDRGLGGATWWHISMDKKGEESLVGATVKTFGVLETSLNRLDYPESVYENLRNRFPGE